MKKGELLKTMFENEDTKNFLNENKELIEQNVNDAMGFKEILETWITANLYEFLDEDMDETRKNIRTFCEVATRQYFGEIAYINNKLIAQYEADNPEPSIDDYL